MVRCTILAILTLSWLCSTCLPQEEARPIPPIPSTISREAQEFLRSAKATWVIPRNLREWEALQAENEKEGNAQSKPLIAALAEKIVVRTMGGVNVHVITPKRFNPADADKALIHIHGGGYCLHSSKSTYSECLPLADRTGLKVYCIDYRLAPQHPFPAGLNDCVAGIARSSKKLYQARLACLESRPERLTVTMVLKARDEALPLPAHSRVSHPAPTSLREILTIHSTGSIWFSIRKQWTFQRRTLPVRI